MDDILGKKKNINPTVLLSSTTNSTMPCKNNDAVPTTAASMDNLEQTESAAHSSNEKESKNQKLATRGKKKLPRTTRSDCLQQLRQDKNERFKEKIKIENEKFEKLDQLELKKQEARQKRNSLLQESNEIQRETNNLLLEVLKKYIRS